MHQNHKKSCYKLNLTVTNRVSLIGDTNYPYVSFQHISSYHKSLGDTVGLNLLNPNIIYISCTFTRNKNRMLGIKKYYEKFGCKVYAGGSGIDIKLRLPKEIEQSPIDTELYENLDYCFGFATRGCIKNCKPYCIVHKKEGNIHYAGLDWINKPNVIFYDNNLLSYPKHLEILEKIRDEKYKACFNQGLDFQFINDDNASLISEIKYYDRKFKHRRLYFAFDRLNLEPNSQRKSCFLKQKRNTI